MMVIPLPDSERVAGSGPVVVCWLLATGGAARRLEMPTLGTNQWSEVARQPEGAAGAST
jgi:hypothetical protein